MVQKNFNLIFGYRGHDIINLATLSGRSGILVTALHCPRSKAKSSSMLNLSLYILSTVSLAYHVGVFHLPFAGPLHIKRFDVALESAVPLLVNNINSAHAQLNRDDGGLLPEVYLHVVNR